MLKRRREELARTLNDKQKPAFPSSKSGIISRKDFDATGRPQSNIRRKVLQPELLNYRFTDSFPKSSNTGHMFLCDSKQKQATLARRQRWKKEKPSMVDKRNKTTKGKVRI